MIETYADVPAGIDAVRAVGTPAAHPLRGRRGVPRPHPRRRLGRRQARALGHAPPRGLRGVSDLAWVRTMSQLAGFFLPGHVRVFGIAERDEAVRWLPGLPASGW